MVTLWTIAGVALRFPGWTGALPSKSRTARSPSIVSLASIAALRFFGPDCVAYAAAKARIFAGAGVGVFNADDPMVAAMPGADDRWYFTLGESHDDKQFGIVAIDGEAYLCRGERPLLAVKELYLPGRHNRGNALARLGRTDAARTVAGKPLPASISHRILRLPQKKHESKQCQPNRHREALLHQVPHRPALMLGGRRVEAPPPIQPLPEGLVQVGHPLVELVDLYPEQGPLPPVPAGHPFEPAAIGPLGRVAFPEPVA